MRAGEFRVEPHRFLKLRNRVAKMRAVPSIKDGGRFEEERVGIAVRGRGLYQLRFLVAIEDSIQLAGDGARDSFLETEDIAQIAIISLRPKVKPIGDLDELRGDPDLVALFANGAFEEVGHAKSRADAAQIAVLIPEGKGRASPRDLQVLYMGEGIQDLLRNAVGEILLVMFRAKIGKWKDGNGFARNVVRQRRPGAFLGGVVHKQACSKSSHDESCQRQ